MEENPESTYIRLVSIPWGTPFELPSGCGLEKGKGVELLPGTEGIVFSYGPVMLSEACKASVILKETCGLSVAVINFPWLNVVDEKWLKESLKDFKVIFTLDNHYIKGGQGEMLLAKMAEFNILESDVNVHRFGIVDTPPCGGNQEVLTSLRLDAESLAAEIRKVMTKGKQK